MPGTQGQLGEWQYAERHMDGSSDEETRAGPIRTFLLAALSFGLGAALWVGDVGRVVPFPDLQRSVSQRPANQPRDPAGAPVATPVPNAALAPAAEAPALEEAPQLPRFEAEQPVPSDVPGAPLDWRAALPPAEPEEELWPVWEQSTSDATLVSGLRPVTPVPPRASEMTSWVTGVQAEGPVRWVLPDVAFVPSEVLVVHTASAPEVLQAFEPPDDSGADPGGSTGEAVQSAALPLPLPPPTPPPLEDVSPTQPRMIAPSRSTILAPPPRSFDAAVRCRSLTMRAQLGEDLSPAELSYLRRGCE